VGARALALLLQASPSLGMPVVSFGIKRPQKKGGAAAHVVDADAPPTEGAEDGEEDAPVLTSLLFKTDSYDRKAKVRRRRRRRAKLMRVRYTERLIACCGGSQLLASEALALASSDPAVRAAISSGGHYEAFVDLLQVSPQACSLAASATQSICICSRSCPTPTPAGPCAAMPR
jgi:hypothetical protein